MGDQGRSVGCSPATDITSTAAKDADLALDVALLALQYGANSSDAVTTFEDVARGLGHPGLTCLVQLEFVCASGTANGEPVTVLRPVGIIGTNLLRATEAMRLGERAAAGGLDRETIQAEVERVRAVISPYSKPFQILASGILTGAFCKLVGGDWGAFGIAFVAGTIGQFVRVALLRRKAFVTGIVFVSAFISSLLVAAGIRLGLSATPGPALISSCIWVVPGLMLINGFWDMVAGKQLTMGIWRMIYASLLFFVSGIAVAIAAVLAGV
jgi:uncharacterized membrane protein YjjP (DUF1212 family)